MATGEGLVFRGMEGTGAAQILGRPGDPMGAFQGLVAARAQRAAINAEMARMAKEKRDKDTWALINENPDKAYEPFDTQVKDAVEAHRSNVLNAIEQNGGQVTDQIRLMAKSGFDQVNSLSAKSNYIKQQIAATRDVIQKDPYLVPEYYHGKLNDTYLNPDGTSKPLDSIDVGTINDIYINDPGGFNATKYHKDFIDGLNDNMTNSIKQKAQNGGILTEDMETKWKGNLYTPDPNSSIGVATNEKGEPILNFTKDLASTYQGSETARRYYQQQAGLLGVAPEDVIKKQFELNGGGLKQDVRPSFTKNSSMPQWYYDNMYAGKLKPEEQKFASRVFEHIGNISNAFFDEEGNRLDVARPAAREAVGHLVGSKFGTGTVIQVELVPGTTQPGKSKLFGKNYDNSPNDRLVFLTESGTNGIKRLEEIDLADEGAPSTLWNSFQAAGYLGKKNISFDFAADNLGIVPKDLYKGKEYMSNRQKVEGDAVANWTKGVDYQQMTSKNLNGKGISSVTPDVSYGGLGSLKGYNLKLDDGTESYLPVADFEKMTRIFRSEKQAPAAVQKNDPDMVRVRKPDGSTGSIPKSKLDAALKKGYKKVE